MYVQHLPVGVNQHGTYYQWHTVQVFHQDGGSIEYTCIFSVWNYEQHLMEKFYYSTSIQENFRPHGFSLDLF